jgi:hypothetical protein
MCSGFDVYKLDELVLLVFFEDQNSIPLPDMVWGCCISVLDVSSQQGSLNV